jgi:hypothetical protein
VEEYKMIAEENALFLEKNIRGEDPGLFILRGWMTLKAVGITPDPIRILSSIIYKFYSICLREFHSEVKYACIRKPIGKVNK